MDLALVKETKLNERFGIEFGIQVFNIFNHSQLGDPSPSNPNSLALNYDPTAAATGFLTHTPDFGVITRTVNFNQNNDNAASPNTGTGLPRQIQFMLRFKF